MIEIKPCTLEDIPTLVDVSCRTFAETFDNDNTPEDMELYLEKNFSATQLTKEFENKESQFVLAFIDGKCAAYMKINVGEAQTEKDYPNSLEIQRIYVLKEFKGKHVGTELIKYALDYGKKQNNLEYAWLGVWEHNHPAIGFYKKFGFTQFGSHVFVLGTDRQTDILMKRSF
ncbi:acetyltransferase [Anaeromyces robustus]|uniref:Acetyltransferase n=1 Tax=Anaeromyces robustus TaxID=1754192 RepID=A0A1Y1XQ93_9FUNG|nr:acetyltransferase [Anaeromyces robustus]|eukprot:ORX87930.1 acetyltransferase [Anaeromyces robustus]